MGLLEWGSEALHASGRWPGFTFPVLWVTELLLFTCDLQKEEATPGPPALRALGACPWDLRVGVITE